MSMSFNKESDLEVTKIEYANSGRNHDLAEVLPSSVKQTEGWVPTKEEQAQDRALNRKLDICLLPFMALLYLFSGLDRGNVGNAQTNGFTKDIGLQANDLNNAVTLFFITFVIFQPISAGLGKKVGPHRWIPLIMASWGTLTIAHAFTRSNGMLIGLRLGIGLFEAGFYPTAIFYLSTFYTRWQLAQRVAAFYSMYAVAGAFSGAIAYGVFQIKSSLYGWQILFILEGSLTAFTALVAFIYLPKGPSTAWFLTTEQRAFAKYRMEIDSALNESRGLTRRDLIEVAKDWKLWAILPFNILASCPSAAFSVFLPLIITGMGFSGLEANLLSVIPYLAGAVGLLLFAYSSDHRRERGWHIVGALAINLLGLILVAVITTPVPRFVCLCILLFGSYASAPLTIAWLSSNTPEPGKRSLVLGINGWGNLAGVISSELFRSQFAPRYLVPFYASLAFIGVSMLGYVVYRYALLSVNKRRRRVLESWTAEQVASERTDDVRYADKKMTFVYGL